MDADEDVLSSGDVPLDEGEVVLSVDAGLVEVQFEVAVVGGHFDDLDLVDLLLALPAMFDEFLDGADLELAPLRDFQEFRQAGHGAVFAHYLADDADGTTTCHTSEIDRGLGVAGALQDAPGFGPQRENVPGLHEVVTHRGGISHDLERSGAIGGADSRRDPRRGIDADLEVRAKAVLVVLHHFLDAELLQPLLGGWRANKAATMLGHEIDGLGRCMLRGHDQIALILAIRIIDHDDHLAGADVRNNGINGVEPEFRLGDTTLSLRPWLGWRLVRCF